MDWKVIALTFIAVAINHMGLVEAVEKVIGKRLLIVGCTKCAAFWMTLAYNLYISREVIPSAAMAFLYSYLALWLELLMGQVDSIYIKCYEKIVSNADAGKAATDPDEGDATGSLS